MLVFINLLNTRVIEFHTFAEIDIVKFLVVATYSNCFYAFHTYEGTASGDKTLNWAMRVRVLLDAAQGILQQKDKDI